MKYYKKWSEKMYGINKKTIIIYIGILTIFCVGYCMFSYRKEVYEGVVKGCALDGALGWTICKQALAGILLPMTMYIVLNSIRDDFRPTYILSHRSRWSLWKKHIFRGVIACMLTLLYAMIVSFFVAFILEGQIYNWNDPISVYYFSTGQLGNPLNLLWQPLLVLIINSGKLFSIIMIGILLYWFTQSKTFVMLCVLMYAALEAFAAGGLSWKYSNIMFDVIKPKLFYLELVSFNKTANSFFKIFICVGVVVLLSFFVIKRKEFIKNA